MVKNVVTVLTVFCLLLYSSVTAYAKGVEDLYTLYGIPYEVTYPDDIMRIISDFQYAEKYVSMYRYVVESTFDTTVIENRISKLEVDLLSVEEQLLCGYTLSIEEIYTLEDEYVSITGQLEDAKKSLIGGEIDYNIPNAENTPTRKEYEEALEKKSKMGAAVNLGEFELNYPVDTGALISDKTDTHLELAVANNSTVTALFNGTVTAITSSSISIDHTNDVFTFYGNLRSVSVNVGDAVTQGQPIGTTTSTLMLKMKLDGNLVDITKIFKEE